MLQFRKHIQRIITRRYVESASSNISDNVQQDIYGLNQWKIKAENIHSNRQIQQRKTNKNYTKESENKSNQTQSLHTKTKRISTTLFPPLTKIKRAQGRCNVRSANVVKVAGVNYLKLPCTLARGKCAHKPAASTTRYTLTCRPR